MSNFIFFYFLFTNITCFASDRLTISEVINELNLRYKVVIDTNRISHLEKLDQIKKGNSGELKDRQLKFQSKLKQFKELEQSLKEMQQLEKQIQAEELLEAGSDIEKIKYLKELHSETQSEVSDQNIHNMAKDRLGFDIETEQSTLENISLSNDNLISQLNKEFNSNVNRLNEERDAQINIIKRDAVSCNKSMDTSCQDQSIYKLDCNYSQEDPWKTPCLLNRIQ